VDLNPSAAQAYKGAKPHLLRDHQEAETLATVLQSPRRNHGGQGGAPTSRICIGRVGGKSSMQPRQCLPSVYRLVALGCGHWDPCNSHRPNATTTGLSRRGFMSWGGW
jgi:hypothetical protein